MTKSKTNLQIGDKVEIQINNQRYTSQILDEIDQDNYIILGPIRYGKIIDIPSKAETKILFILKDKGRFWFKAIVENYSTKKIYKLHIRRISDLVKLQEREFFRLRKIIDLIIIDKENNRIKGFAEDISGKGFKVITNKKLRMGEKLTFKFNLNDIPMELKGKVVRTDINDSSHKNSYGICFYNIDMDSRDKIIKYIFEEQRKLRKKGLR